MLRSIVSSIEFIIGPNFFYAELTLNNNSSREFYKTKKIDF
ncbi:hypothetical protein [Leptospira noguchii]|nr:hypothetical protein [Leptospira noguchii]